MAEEESQQRTATKKQILQTKLTLILTEGGGGGTVGTVGTVGTFGTVGSGV